ncbi:carbamate kinase [Candidatus Bathyarchaeota archaeon]|nr:carbamate kinase [Candidatus Bathyarchaeota archaeon]
MKKLLIALGGNAIKKNYEKGTYEEQIKNIDVACEQIAELSNQGYKIVITHGNGPQVGDLAIQSENSLDLVPPQPLSVLGAMTQGQIGYMIQQSIKNKLKNKDKNVVTVVTQVLVNDKDEDFKNPTKPVGPFFDEATAKTLAEKQEWIVKKVTTEGEKTWRRVVPSPKPIKIIESQFIHDCIEKGSIIIAAGGGGIPVVFDKKGKLKGIDAVIDKDRSGSRLAIDIKVDIFLILTDIEYVMKNYGKKTQRPFRKLSVKQAKEYLNEGQFGLGSMAPKIEAACDFIEAGGELVIITSLEKALEAMEGKTGTNILR